MEIWCTHCYYVAIVVLTMNVWYIYINQILSKPYWETAPTTTINGLVDKTNDPVGTHVLPVQFVEMANKPVILWRV